VLSRFERFSFQYEHMSTAKFTLCVHKWMQNSRRWKSLCSVITSTDQLVR